MKFNDKVFQELALEFEKKEFKESKHFEHNYCFEFYKKSKSDNSIRVIHIAYSFDKIKISHIVSYISFSDVTNILAKFLDIGTDFYDETVSNFFHSMESKSNILSLQKMTFNNAVEFELLKDKIFEHVDAYIIPFFSPWSVAHQCY